MRILDGTSYPSARICIYCGAIENLTKEHIIPLALNGTSTLPASSCQACATITGRFEQIVLRGPLWAVRVHRGMQSRTRHADAPTHYPAVIVRDGVRTEIELEADQHPIICHFPTFAPPAVLQPEGYTRGVRWKGNHTVSFGPRPEDVARSLGATAIEVNQRVRPAAFARMLAKIAHAFAYAEGALARLEGTSRVLPSILGTKQDVGRWVGTLDHPTAPPPPNTLHALRIHDDTQKGMLIVEVHLFCDSQTPSYGVVLGRLRNAR